MSVVLPVVLCALAALGGVVFVVRWRARRELATVLGALEGEESPIVKLATRVVEDAYCRGATAIHVESGAARCVVRYRVQGALEERMQLPVQAAGGVVARFAELAGSPPPSAEPQQGRFVLESRGTTLPELRALTWVGPEGPACVLRFDGPVSLALQDLGLSPRNLEALRAAIAPASSGRQPSGVILFVGPAGSGKTSTLRAALGEVGPERSVVELTGDAPLARRLDGLDADVVSFGDLQDAAVARLAFDAAQEGYLVLGTLFAEDLDMAVGRLVDDHGVSRHLVAACLRAVVVQRLVARLCPKCKAPRPTPPELAELGLEAATVFEARPGECDGCSGRGYKGHVQLHAVARVEGALRQRLREGGGLEQAAIAAGMVPLRRDALEKAAAGVLDLAQV